MAPEQSNNKHSNRQVEDDEIGDGLKVVCLSSDGSLDTNDSFNSHCHHPLNHQDAIGGIGSTTQQHLTPNAGNVQQRRRRKLPEIPKNKKCKLFIVIFYNHY